MADALALDIWHPPRDHGRRHVLLRKAQKRMEDYKRQPGKLFPLAWCPVPKRGGGLRERRRSMYLERRIACITVLQAVLQFVDIVTLLAGVKEGRFVGVRLDKLEALTGLNRRRVDRAVRDLKNAGILISYQRSQFEDGQYRGLPAIRAVAEDFFAAIGLADELARYRRKAYRQRPAGSPVKNARKVAQLRMMLKRSADIGNAGDARAVLHAAERYQNARGPRRPKLPSIGGDPP